MVMETIKLDNRAKKLCKIIVDYSLKIGKKDVFMIQSEDKFRELAEYIGALGEKKGAKIIYEFYNLKKRKAIIERDDLSELKKESRRLCGILEKVTARVFVNASSNPNYLKSIDSKKIAHYAKIVNKPALDRILGDGKKRKGMKWVAASFPCKAEAEKAGMTPAEYADFVYNATNIDWSKTAKNMMKIKKIFDNADEVRIIVPGQTDVRLSLKGRGANICDGKINMPDGEVFYCPKEYSAEGYIYFPYDYSMFGNIVSGIRIEYCKGRAVSYSAKKNRKFLKSMIELKGVDRIGEFGIGTNYGIKEYIKNLYFDEKIGGTIHIALGNSYKRDLMDGGGKNNGEIHWDLVCDLRKVNGLPGGEIYVDGKLIQKNGKWQF